MTHFPIDGRTTRYPGGDLHTPSSGQPRRPLERPALPAALGQLPPPIKPRSLYRKHDEAGAELSPEKQVRRLVMHARNVGYPAERERPAAFNDVISAIYQLAPQDRFQPLFCLTREIASLPLGARSAAFRSVANATDKLLPDQRNALLGRLAGEIRRLAVDEELPALELVLGRGVQPHGEDAPTRLSYVISGFSGSGAAASALFERALSMTSRLPANERGGLAQDFARRLGSLPQSERQSAFERLIGMTSSMTDDAKAKVRLALEVDAVKTLPLGARAKARHMLLVSFS